MTIEPGTHIGPYEITAKLGEGGMGEVYRATDSKLRREVAIKVLPEAFAADAERLARFEREAQLLAQLHHPQIASIFGLEESGQTRALVMELVEGPTLDERVAAGALHLEEILAIALQIAEALEAAHEKGIVHRDLKPQNVKIDPEGRVKVLDFGLAKAMDPAAGPTSVADLARSPTLLDSPTLTAVPGTQLGVILGTAAYMSPEQARGGRVDKRADIWAFGVVLWEMLTERRLFEGESVPETLAGVLKSEIDLGLLPGATPPAIRRLLRRCLERDPRRRLHDIADARIVIEDELAGETEDGTFPTTPLPKRTSHALPWLLAALGFASALLLFFAGPGHDSAEPERKLTRSSLLMPVYTATGGVLSDEMFALSPDGTAVAIAQGMDGSLGTAAGRIFLRELGEIEPKGLEGTEGASYPFWSPDSEQIAFFAGGYLRRVPRAGGAVQMICPVQNGRGGTWSPDGTIVFSPNPYAALLQVPSDGGEPTPATTLDASAEERSHRFPMFLSDGRHFLFGVEPWTDRMQVKVASLDEVSTGRNLLEATAVPRFAPPDDVVYLRDDALLTQKIDLERLEMTGEIRQLADRPSLLGHVSSQPTFDLSQDGKLAYVSADPRPAALAFFDRQGSRTETAVRLDGARFQLDVSHLGDRIATSILTSNSRGALWVINPEAGEASRITSRGESLWGVTWSRDDRELITIFDQGGASNDQAPTAITAEGGEVRRLIEGSSVWVSPTDVGPDGTVIVYETMNRESLLDLGWFETEGEGVLNPYLATPASEFGADFSPDARHLAYLSDASGRTEAYLDTFPEPSRIRRIDTGGRAQQVAFRADGRELFVLADFDGRSSVFSVPVETGPELELGRPRKLFSLPPEWLAFAVAPDGERFYVLERVGSRSRSLTLVDPWRAQLEDGP